MYITQIYYSLEESNISSAGANVFFDTLIKCKANTKSMSLRGNCLDDDCMETIGRFIKMSNFLEVLDLRTNVITDKGIKLISPFLIGNQTLKSFLIGGNKNITNESIPHLIKITMSTNITELYAGVSALSKLNLVIPFLVENRLKNQCNVIEYSNK